MKLRLTSALILCAACGCSSLENNGPSNVLIPNQTLNVSRSLVLPAESIVAGALLFALIDPLAPNWQIAHTQLAADRYRINLKMKRFTSGGDGEAAQVFYRRAEQLAQEGGGTGYRVIEYSEGIESALPVAQRFASGVIEFTR